MIKIPGQKLGTVYVVIFLVKIHVRCVAIIIKAFFFFETENKNQTFKYNPTEYNVISLVLFLFKATCIILYCPIMIVYNLRKIKNYNYLS